MHMPMHEARRLAVAAGAVSCRLRNSAGLRRCACVAVPMPSGEGADAADADAAAETVLVLVLAGDADAVDGDAGDADDAEDADAEERPDDGRVDADARFGGADAERDGDGGLRRAAAATQRALLPPALPRALAPALVLVAPGGFPRGATGKLDRPALRRAVVVWLSAARRRSDGGGDGDDDEIAAELRAMLDALLPPRGRDDGDDGDASFVERGGTSVALVRALARVEERWGVALDARALELPPSAVAALVRDRRAPRAGARDGDALAGGSGADADAVDGGADAGDGWAVRPLRPELVAFIDVDPPAFNYLPTIGQS